MEQLLSTLKIFRCQHAQQRISFVSGNFKVIHPGHVRLLRFAKDMADLLVVGVLPRNDFNADIDEQDRLYNVQALSVVDHACMVDDSIAETLRALRPDFVIKGKEHEQAENIESRVLDEIGGKLIFSSGQPVPSAMDCVSSAPVITSTRLIQPHAYMDRHSLCVQSLTERMERIKQVEVCVVGDVIVDEYINCDALGMSQEDPTVVITPIDTQRYLGGAGIVAAHAAGLGAQVNFAAVCGEGEVAAFVSDKCQDYGVDCNLFPDATRPTTLKQRFRCRGKTMLRVSHLRQHGVDKKLTEEMLDKLAPQVEKAQLLIFSDFNYGCLPQPLVDQLTVWANTKKTLIAADSQSSSQMGDVSRFRFAHLLTPTEREARLAVHDFEAGLVVLAELLLKKAEAQNVIMTLGESGILVQQASSATDQLPALNPAARDVVGAGDSLLVVASLALAAGGNIWEAACLGSVAAGIQVGRQGNIPLSAEEIVLCLQNWR